MIGRIVHVEAVPVGEPSPRFLPQGSENRPRNGCFPGTADSVTRCGIELSRDDIAAYVNRVLLSADWPNMRRLTKGEGSGGF